MALKPSGGSPFSAASMFGAPAPVGALGMAGSVLGAKGGGGRGQKYGVSYGPNGYQLDYSTGGSLPVDTSKYTIKGDKGTYDLMALMQSTKQPTAAQKAQAALSGAAGSLDAAREKSIYEAALKQMQGDASAIQQMQQFAPQKISSAQAAQARLSGSPISQGGFGISQPVNNGWNLPGSQKAGNLAAVANWKTPVAGTQFFSPAQAPQQQSSSYTPSAQLLAQIAAARSQQ